MQVVYEHNSAFSFRLYSLLEVFDIHTTLKHLLTPLHGSLDSLLLHIVA